MFKEGGGEKGQTNVSILHPDLESSIMTLQLYSIEKLYTKSSLGKGH